MKKLFLLMFFPLTAFATTFSADDFIGKWRDSGVISGANISCNVEIIKQNGSVIGNGACGGTKTEKLFDFKINPTGGAFSIHQVIIDNRTKQLIASKTITGNMSADKNNMTYSNGSLNFSRFIVAK